jgi:STE24 endopeptidase
VPAGAPLLTSGVVAPAGIEERTHAARGRGFDRMKVKPIVAALALLVVAAGASLADPSDTTSGDSANSPASPMPDSTAAAAVAETPGTPPDYLAEVRANFTPENRSYSATRVALSFIEPFYGLLAALLILFSGLSSRMRDIAHALGKRRYVRVLVYFILYSLLAFVLTFPLSWFQGFALEHQYKLSNQTFAAWFIDELKGMGLSVAFIGIVPILALAYTAIAKYPRSWWLWLSAGTLPVVVAGALLGPLVFEPAFNKFTPLHDQQLKAKILTLAEKAGIPSRKVYEVDKSAQTKKYNAYVSGFGASQRVVLWDTTLKGMKEDEILFVMGHEMGHYVLGHIWKAIALDVAVGFVFFLLSYLVTGWALARFGERWGFRELSDVASLPLLIATIGIFSFLAQPVTNTFSRMVEHEADQFGLEVTHLNDAGARAFIKLASQNKSNPEPNAFVMAFLYTHPPVIERIRYALEYHPWTEGRPNEKFRGQ